MSKGVGDTVNCHISHIHASICDLCNGPILHVLRDSFGVLWSATRSAQDGSMSGPAPALLFLWMVLEQDRTHQGLCCLFIGKFMVSWGVTTVAAQHLPSAQVALRALAECLWATQEFAIPW